MPDRRSVSTKATTRTTVDEHGRFVRVHREKRRVEFHAECQPDADAPEATPPDEDDLRDARRSPDVAST